MLEMGADQVDEAVAECAELLRSVADRDWAVPAGSLEWSVRRTVEHVADDLIAYAGQLTGRAASGYVGYGIALDEGLSNEDAAGVVTATGGLLSAVVRTTPPGVRGWHSFAYGAGDRTGFAGMGVAEVLLHTYDIACGLGVARWRPPSRLSQSLLAHLFPHVQPGPDPARTLLWATGRADLPGRPRVTSWHWHNAIVLPVEDEEDEEAPAVLELRELSPAAAMDLSVGGTAGHTWLGGDPDEGSRAAGAMVARTYARGTHRPEWGTFVLVRLRDERALGTIGFHGPPDERNSAEVGYGLQERARGHGYATAALRTLTAWGLGRPGSPALRARVDPGNKASQHVLRRAGFTPADPPVVQDLAEGLDLRYERRG
ncbi:GNAT family N-acetyltransferase [Streptomyces sp. BBFR102]|uniref:GNAT family N-acetyltransferase n=1 Tax=Streptomyces sp. BBFR102 TaxID=3448171 RepID=UPI003F52A5FA